MGLIKGIVVGTVLTTLELGLAVVFADKWVPVVEEKSRKLFSKYNKKKNVVPVVIPANKHGEKIQNEVKEYINRLTCGGVHVHVIDEQLVYNLYPNANEDEITNIILHEVM